ncbi:sugar ABC transporter ATP-binding protein [Rhodococcus sp. WMMA185]|nr:ATP-binding cassette domain-containing protein [Rhodococcus sp. WMMA185]AOW94349.1 sugar ABC transporter ATP-binding protein [Rhodococcus sp. WMMA185]
MNAAPTTVPILEARALSRSFGHVRALDGADFEIYPGEVVALIGDNGAGKSTLVKAMSGNLSLDSGEILFSGVHVDLKNPNAASELGIETVYQDLALAPHLNAAQNMFLGRELPAKGLPGRLGFLDTKTMREKSRKALDDLRATVPTLTDPVGVMSGGQQQAIAIARAVAWAKGVVFLDEPTAALGVVQTQNVLETIRRIAFNGVAVVLISHSMPHVIEVADRVQVLRQGRRVATYEAKNTSMEELVGAMTGVTDGAA